MEVTAVEVEMKVKDDQRKDRIITACEAMKHNLPLRVQHRCSDHA